MRDKRRIKRILRLFRKVWTQNPDWRFFQTCINILGQEIGTWYIEDDQWEQVLKDYLKNFNKEGGY